MRYKMENLSEEVVNDLYNYYMNNSLEKTREYMMLKYNIYVSLPAIANFFKNKGLKTFTRKERWETKKSAIREKWINEIKRMRREGAEWREIAMTLGTTDVSLRAFRKENNIE